MKNAPGKIIEFNPSAENDGYEQEQRETDIEVKLHEVIKARLEEELNKFSQFLNGELTEAYETALRDIEEVKTEEEAEAVLKILYNVLISDAEKISENDDEEKERKGKLLDAAMNIAWLKEPESLAKIVENKIIKY